MKRPNDLHLIIKSLTKSEKRHFKMVVSGGSKLENNYTILFDAIDAQEEYDEVKLSRKLKKHPFSQQISRTKYLLYEQILKVLRQLYNTRSEQTKLHILLNSVEVLFHKTLYHQAYEVLKRAKKTAIAEELYGLQQEILEWEQQLLPYLQNHKTIRLAIDELLKSHEHVSQSIKTEQKFRALHTEVRLKYDLLLNYHNDQQVNQLFGKVFQHPFLGHFAHATTFVSKALFHELHFMKSHAESNYSDAAFWSNAMFLLWQKTPKMKPIFRADYIRQLRDYTFFKIAYDNTQENVFALLNEWKSIPAFSKEEGDKQTLEIDAIHFLLQLVNSKYKGIEAIYHRIKEDHFSNMNKLPIHQRLTIFYHIAVYHFLEKRYEEALQWIKKLDLLAAGKLNPHLLKYIKMMELMVRYELDEPVVDDKDILRIHRHLKSLGDLGEVEKMLLQSIKKLINLPIFDNLPEELQDLNDLLKIEIGTTQLHSKKINNQVILAWVNDKLTNERLYA